MEDQDAWLMTSTLVHESGRGDPFAAAIRATRMPMVITDPRLADNPIVFANDAFLSLCGYPRSEILGVNCRFLQGRDTDQRTVKIISDSLNNGKDVSIDILNYRKDGTSFWNALYISPVRSAAGELQYYFASQLDVTERNNALRAKTALLHEVDHRVKNNLQMMTALVAMQAATISDSKIRETLQTMMERIEALSTVHRLLYQSNDTTRFSVDAFIDDVVTDLVSASGREDITVFFDLASLTISADDAAALALMINEITINALKHAFPLGQSGRLKVTIVRDITSILIAVTDDGIGMPSHQSHIPSFGLPLVRLLAKQLKADVTWSKVDPSGTAVIIALPLKLHTAGS